MGSPLQFLFVASALLACSPAVASGQSSSPNPATAAGASAGLDNAPVAPPGSVNRPDPLSASAADHITSTSTVAMSGPVLDPRQAVQSISSMFMPNSAVKVESTGQPLPLTGTWGAQTQFPGGLPKPCVQARMPCVKVIYKVPEANVVCDWTIASFPAIETKADGSTERVTHQMVLDENEAAARYTLRKAWARGESAPHPTSVERPGYPQIAQQAHVGGIVSVRLLVGPDGKVEKATPNSGPAMLQAAVVEAVTKWKFDPLAIGQHPTSFQVDEQFSYNAGGNKVMAGMDPSGKVVMPEVDPRLGPGFKEVGVSSGSWLSCNTGSGCSNASPNTPK